MANDAKGRPTGERQRRTPEMERLWEALEKEADSPDMNIEHLVNLYKEHYPGDGVWRLTQDINRQVLVWQNIIEDLKRSSNVKDTAKSLKVKYEQELKLLPQGTLENPSWLWDIDSGFEKLRNYSKGLVKIARTFGTELLLELKVQAGVGITTTIQVQLGLPPALTLGFEKEWM